MCHQRPPRRSGPVVLRGGASGRPGPRGSGRHRHAIVVLAVACVYAALASGSLASATVAPAGAGPETMAPAFYTWQAPGGASTAGQRVIALTFDDGPGPYTPQVLSVLEAYHVPATFFEIGENVAQYPQYTQMLARAGYPIENHTWTHPDLATLSSAAIDAQIDRTQAEIRGVTGQTPNCVRPPYDAWNDTVLDQIAARGLTTMSYSIDPRDWSMPGVTTIVRAVVSAAFPGAVVDLHDGGGDRSETVAALPGIITGLQSAGYRFVSICGDLPQPQPEPQPQASVISAYGQAPAVGPSVVSNAPLVGASAAGNAGLWLTATDGGVFSFDAPFKGSMGGRHLNEPVVAMASTATANGYWLAASDGGVFTFGAADFHGSMGGQHLNAAIVGMASDPATGGYWLVASDGGVFSFDAPFEGSMGGHHLNEPIVGMAARATGRGYWLVASDGGLFSFGTAGFHGSMGGQHLNAAIVGMASDPATGGYWLVASDGGVFSFDSPFYGSMVGNGAGARCFAMVTAAGGNGYWITCATPVS